MGDIVMDRLAEGGRYGRERVRDDRACRGCDLGSNKTETQIERTLVLTSVKST